MPKTEEQGDAKNVEVGEQHDGRFKWLTRLGALRDGILVVGGILYVFGYLVWSFNAWKNNLGLLPAVESQYFIAGLTPAVITCIGYFGVKFIFSSLNKLRARFRISEESTLSQILLMLFGGMALTIYGILRAVDWLIIAGGRMGEIIDIVIILTLIYLITLPLPTNDWYRKYISNLAIPAYVFGLCFVALLAFLDAYPNLPQALGGMRPRCVYLDVASKELSPETLSALTVSKAPSRQSELPAAPRQTGGETAAAEGQADKSGELASGAGAEVMRSGVADVLFSGNDYIVIKARERTYEIKRDAVHAVIPCE